MVSTLHSPITLAHRVQRSDEVLFQEVGGEAVLLDLSSELYFGLDPVGTRVWTLIGEGQQLQAVYEAICSEFDAPPTTVHSDLMSLIGRLFEVGLVKVG